MREGPNLNVCENSAVCWRVELAFKQVFSINPSRLCCWKLTWTFESKHFLPFCLFFFVLSRHWRWALQHAIRVYLLLWHIFYAVSCLTKQNAVWITVVASQKKLFYLKLHKCLCFYPGKSTYCSVLFSTDYLPQANKLLYSHWLKFFLITF